MPGDAKTPTRADYPHFLPIATRWMDNDVYGHVNNVVYYAYFDTVINRYLIDEGGLDIARRRDHRALRRVALRVPAAHRLPRRDRRGPARRPPRPHERALRDRHLRARRATSRRRTGGSSTSSSTARRAARRRCRRRSAPRSSARSLRVASRDVRDEVLVEGAVPRVARAASPSRRAPACRRRLPATRRRSPCAPGRARSRCGQRETTSCTRSAICAALRLKAPML